MKTDRPMTMMQKGAIQQMNAMTERLKELDSTVKMPLEHFRLYLLPVLATYGPNFDLQNYLKVVGHPSVKICVYNDKNNEVVYDIPPLLEGREFNSRGTELSDFMSGLSERMASMPLQTSEAIYAALNSQVNGEDEAAVFASAMTYVDVLNQIFKDHSMPSIEMPEVVNTVWAKMKGDSPETETKASAAADDEFRDEGFDLV